MEKTKEIHPVRNEFLRRANSQQNYFKNKKTLNLKIFNRAVFFVIIVLLVYYIAGVNDLAIKGFALSDSKAQKNRLIEANNKLELNALTSSSYGKIKEKAGNLKMVAAGEVSYLSIGAEAVAKK